MSRYPAMSQAPVTYDRSLLVGAPAITREDRQAGYDIGALERGTYPQPTVPTIGQPAAPAPDAANPFQDGYYDRTFTPSTPIPLARPWWKRKRWAALALIIFLGIICGIVAGVVTARNSRNTSALIADPQGAVSGPSASTGSPISPPVQSPASTETPIVSRTSAAPPVVTAPAAGSNVPVGGNPRTTLFFGSPTGLQPGVTLPTATVPDPVISGEIPYICYVTPTSRFCAPYFENPPSVNKLNP